MNYNIPNLFIVGAGKAGTSSLYCHLSKHPEIYMSPVKEPNFFGNDLQFRASRRTEQEYLNLFKDTQDYKYRGEASVSYLLSKNAAKEIKRFNSEAKIIIMLRNPIEVMHARYYQNRKCLHEDIEVFEKALEKETIRKKGESIPKEAQVIDWLFYREWVRYTDQVKRYVNTFGWENIFIGIFDHFKKDPQDFFSQLGKFLDINGLEDIQAEVVNKNATVRSNLVNRIARGRVKLFKPIIKFILPSRNLRKKIQQNIIRYNEKVISREPLNTQLNKKLKNELRSEIEKLSLLLNKDLTYWTS